MTSRFPANATSPTASPVTDRHFLSVSSQNGTHSARTFAAPSPTYLLSTLFPLDGSLFPVTPVFSSLTQKGWGAPCAMQAGQKDYAGVCTTCLRITLCRRADIFHPAPKPRFCLRGPHFLFSLFYFRLSAFTARPSRPRKALFSQRFTRELRKHVENKNGR